MAGVKIDYSMLDEHAYKAYPDFYHEDPYSDSYRQWNLRLLALRRRRTLLEKSGEAVYSIMGSYSFFIIGKNLSSHLTQKIRHYLQV
jgi:hypothetical protein